MIDVAVSGSRGHDVRVRLAPGGSAPTAAAWANALGADAAVVGRVGADLGGRMLREELRDHGIEAILAEDDELPTGTFLALPGTAGRDLMADRGANARFSPADVPAPLRADAILVSGYLLLQQGSQEGARTALERADASLVAVDAGSPGLVSRIGGDAFFELTVGASVLLANEAEARALTGTSGEEAARRLGRRYRVVCVKHGADGAVAVFDGCVKSAAPPVREPGDALGAGDAFAAGLLVSLAAGLPAAQALAEGCRCGMLAARSPQRWPEPARAVLN